MGVDVSLFCVEDYTNSVQCHVRHTGCSYHQLVDEAVLRKGLSSLSDGREQNTKEDLRRENTSKRPIRRPKNRWIDAVTIYSQNYLGKNAWRRSAQDRDKLKKKIEEAKTRLCAVTPSYISKIVVYCEIKGFAMTQDASSVYFKQVHLLLFGPIGFPRMNGGLYEFTVKKSPHKSVPRLSLHLGITKSTVNDVMRKRLKLHPYKIQLLHAIKPLEKLLRAEFAATMLKRIDDKSEILANIFFSDEATFHVNGCVNRHNCVIWGSENPHVIHEHIRDSPKELRTAASSIPAWANYLDEFFPDFSKCLTYVLIVREMKQEQMEYKDNKGNTARTRRDMENMENMGKAWITRGIQGEQGREGCNNFTWESIVKLSPNT
ncbi:hypothetical protein ANN_21317 [Periplaneta americana]|uniref:Uncharacterized protein n=1 Tax=Periplaneta americana TaxID=6978 RepID=A0ABQ8SFP3_PERAM|nr:hypothetical protein ANN_21317 [Periplaneta americana]